MTDAEIERIHEMRKWRISELYDEDEDECNGNCLNCSDDTCECWYDYE